MSINVITKFDASMIEQSTWTEEHDGIRNEISRNIVNLQDRGIREALEALGWTPPEREAKSGVHTAIDQTPKKLIDLNERLAAVESRHEDACATDDGELAEMLERLTAYIEQEIADLTAAHKKGPKGAKRGI